jgi:hypothetical protein
MNAKKILQVLAVVVLFVSSPMAGQQQQQLQDRRDSDHQAYKPWASGGYVIEWPYPQTGDRPSHYPPYYQDTQ